MFTDLDCANLLQEQYDRNDGVFDEGETCSGVTYAIKYYPDFTVIAFEGSHNLPDWISNFEANMIFIRSIGGVEDGFYDGIPEVYTRAFPKLNNGKPVYCIGHSRGAAHAHIFSAMLINSGLDVTTVAFGSPRPGNNDLADILRTRPNRSYRNYHDFNEQDFVCDVPFPTLDWHYMHPNKQIVVDVPPALDDPWLILSRHHLFLYTQGLKGMINGQASH